MAKIRKCSVSNYKKLNKIESTAGKSDKKYNTISFKIRKGVKYNLNAYDGGNRLKWEHNNKNDFPISKNEGKYF